jgi:stage II sporulation protein D
VIVAALAAVPAAPAAAQASAAANDPFLVAGPTFEPLDQAPLDVEGIGEYRGTIRLNRTAQGVAVVNTLALDDYLRGISEVPANWPLEAQKAQAIAARTYALHEALSANTTAAYKQAGADICATDACQVYAGLAKERRPGSEAWIAAVEQTKGQVVTYRGAPIVAKYSSSNGGQTVAGGQPYLQATPDPDDRYSPLHQWQATYAIADVVAATGLAAEPTTLSRQGDDVVATYVNPAAADGSDPTAPPLEQRLPAADFRSRLNANLPTPAPLPLPVPSGRFDVATQDGTVRIDGRGWGHGIGLSQYGALGKALRGLKAPDILAAYYAGLRPVAVPPERLPQQVRVAVALDRTSATTVADPSGRFRIVDADGNVVAHSATGAWSALPGPQGKVRLVPPADQAGAPSAALTTVEPAAPRPGRALAATVTLAGPAALTHLTLTTPDGATTELDPPHLRSAGPVTVRLGAAATAAPGAYRIDVEQDAGARRTATTALTIDVAAPPPPSAEARAKARTAAATGTGANRSPSTATLAARLPTGPLQGLAGLLLAAVATAAAASRRRLGPAVRGARESG